MPIGWSQSPATTRVGRLDALIDKVLPEVAIAADGEAFIHLRDMLRGRPIEIGAGDRAMVTVAARPADLVVMAVPGLAGLPLAFAAAAAGAAVAIADPRVAAMAAGLLPAREAVPRTVLLGGPAAAAIDLIDSGIASRRGRPRRRRQVETDGFSMALQLMALAGLRSFACRCNRVPAGRRQAERSAWQPVGPPAGVRSRPPITKHWRMRSLQQQPGDQQPRHCRGRGATFRTRR